MNSTIHPRITDAPRLEATKKPASSTTNPRLEIPWRRVTVYAVLALGLFLLGAIPVWIAGQNTAEQLAATQHELTISRLENQLSQSVIMSRRGDYEPARQNASDFFISLRQHIDRGSESVFSPMQRGQLTALLSQRDDIITLLARSDPAAADRLANFYVEYRKITATVQPRNGSG